MAHLRCFCFDSFLDFGQSESCTTSALAVFWSCEEVNAARRHLHELHAMFLCYCVEYFLGQRFSCLVELHFGCADDDIIFRNCD